MNRFNYTNLFRLLLVLAIALVAYFAFTPVTHPGVAQISDKVQHLAAFFVLAGLADHSFPGADLYRKLLVVLVYGVVIELVQHFLPYRDFSLLDMGTDALALVLYRLGLPVTRRLGNGTRTFVAGERGEDKDRP